MKILILGGTRFVGRHLAQAAIDAGHELTLFNRGLRAKDLFPHAQNLIGDRGGDLGALCEGRWDVVFDMSGFAPSEVRATAELLAPRVKLYIFVSTISVYADGTAGRVVEDAPLLQLAEGEAENYGALKAQCEAVIEEVFGARGIIVRPGLIVGPYDPTYRFDYWIDRLVRGGKILAPGHPERFIEVIDGRDVADFLLRLADGFFASAEKPGVDENSDHGKSAIYNAAGALHSLTFGRLLETIGEVLARRNSAGQSTDPKIIWVNDEILLDNSIEQWTELPLWIAENGESQSFYAVDSALAVENGLTYRPLEETVAAILAERSPSSTANNRNPGTTDSRIMPTMGASLEEAILEQLQADVAG